MTSYATSDDSFEKDITSENLLENYLKVRKELYKYSNKLVKKREIIVFNKIDMIAEKETAMIALYIVIFWKYFGIHMMIYIAQFAGIGTNWLNKTIMRVGNRHL